jgi:lipoprotein-anchoring transpeptidase ErfK/SrfK
VDKINEQQDFKLGNDENNKGNESYSTSKQAMIVALVLFSLLVVVYIGGAIYFSNRFFFNTQVNGVDLSRQTTADARAFVESRANDYYITIIGEDRVTEKIYASEINLRFVASETIEGLSVAQNAFAWPLSLITSQEFEAEVDIYFDEELLSTRVSNLEIVTKGQIFPVSASVILEDNEVIIVPQQYGNVVDTERLQVALQEYIGTLADEFNAVEADIFIQPPFTSQSPEIVDAVETINRYLGAEITYLVGREVVVDRTLIFEWITIDDDFNVHLDEEQMSDWLAEFMGTVNTGAQEGVQPITSGATRKFTSPVDGREITVSGGYYGWIVYRDLEFAELLENIRTGEVIEREPIYFQRAVSHGAFDWGNTFLQVDLSGQHMWAIVNGEVVFNSPIVTGRAGYETPQGVYSILEMLSPTVLRSPWVDPETGELSYELDVDFWMRTTWSGYGFHDAPWRRPKAFGGQYFLTGTGIDRGSHGCTNLPLAAARELYNMIYIGMPVVVHY